MFLCPRCSIALARQTAKGQVQWVCGTCHGHAVNIALLRRKILPAAANEIWRASVDGFPSVRACPACVKPMVMVTVTAVDGPLQLEVCQRCHFVWLDSGELESLPLAPTAIPGAELPQAARELLAIEEAKRIGERARTETVYPDEGWKRAAGFLGFPVVYDSHTSHTKPWATYFLAALITLFAAVGLWNQELISALGFVPAEPFRIAGLTLITSFLLHGSLIHLGGNLYFLIVFGSTVEQLLGRPKFLLLVASSALAGDLFHFAFDYRSTIPAIGASGGISGLIAFYALAFPNAELGMMIRFHWIRFSAKWGFLLWIAIQLFGVYMQSKGLSRVAATAHLGGALIGVAWWWMQRPPPPSRTYGYSGSPVCGS